jgi:transcriptional regulator with XRE-family HTH domain
MTDVRKNLQLFLEPRRKEGLSLRELSRRLGRNDSYLQQFLAGKKSPRKLAHDDKLALHAMIGIPLEQLGLGPASLVPSPAPGALSAADDVEPYEPPTRAAAVIVPGSGRPFRVRRDVLGRHPLGLKVGDVVIVSSDEISLQTLRSEQIVLVEMPPGETSPPRLLLREFVRPALAVTNRAGPNEAFNIDEPSGDERARIVGVVRSMLRPM